MSGHGKQLLDEDTFLDQSRMSEESRPASIVKKYNLLNKSVFCRCLIMEVLEHGEKGARPPTAFLCVGCRVYVVMDASMILAGRTKYDV